MKEYEFWADRVARKIIEREERLGRGIKVFRTESGLGASGFPHIGSFADCSRNYAIYLALKDLGVKAEYIAYSDDKDGLRKVPLTLPDWLEKYIGVPVTDIPDPFKCHKSFGEHMSSLLLEALDKCGIEYIHRSATADYRRGTFNEQIERILLRAEAAGKVVERLTGQKKFLEALPYFPICENCGKIYTTRAYKLLPGEHKLLYACDQEFIGKNVNSGKKIVVKGCGYKGETSYFNGNGKLSWKVEFASRWKALQIVFEAYGKDIADSVRINDEICKRVLNFEPPLHLMYEMFLEKGGKKISKSYGNVFTPQVWFRYGTTQSLILLTLKRFEGTRELDVEDIPKYMDELSLLSKVYFGLKKVGSRRELTNSRRLFEYVFCLKPPSKPLPSIPYSLWVEVARILPEKNQVEFAVKKLKDLGYEVAKDYAEKMLVLAKNWVSDFKRSVGKVELSANEKRGLAELLEAIRVEKDGEGLQARIFSIIRKNRISTKEFFKKIYKILVSSESGPRLGPYLIERGKEEVIRKLKAYL